jgi:hypothetical protein
MLALDIIVSELIYWNKVKCSSFFFTFGKKNNVSLYSYPKQTASQWAFGVSLLLGNMFKTGTAVNGRLFEAISDKTKYKTLLNKTTVYCAGCSVQQFFAELVALFNNSPQRV